MEQLPALVRAMTGSWSMGAGKRRAHRRDRRRHGGSGRGAAAARLRASWSRCSRRATASAGASGPTIASARRSISAARGCTASRAIRSTLWCEKLGVRLVESEGERLLIDPRATAPTREGQRRRAVHGARGLPHRHRMGELEEQGDGPRAGAALDLGEAGGRAAAARRWLPEIDRLVVGTFVEMSEGVQGSPWDRCRRRSGSRPKGSTATPSPGRLPAADRRRRAAGSTSATARPSSVSSGRQRRGRRSCRAASDRGGPRRRSRVPVGLLRAGLPALDPPPPEAQQHRDRPAGLWRRRPGQDLSALSAALLARAAEMVRPPARFARPARHLQHLGEPRARRPACRSC